MKKTTAAHRLCARACGWCKISCFQHANDCTYTLCAICHLQHDALIWCSVTAMPGEKRGSCIIHLQVSNPQCRCNQSHSSTVLTQSRHLIKFPRPSQVPCSTCLVGESKRERLEYEISVIFGFRFTAFWHDCTWGPAGFLEKTKPCSQFEVTGSSF
jgi:hypothetical protein